MRKAPASPTADVQQKCGHVRTIPLPRLKSLRQREIEYREATLCPECWAKTLAGAPEAWTGKAAR